MAPGVSYRVTVLECRRSVKSFVCLTVVKALRTTAVNVLRTVKRSEDSDMVLLSSINPTCSKETLYESAIIIMLFLPRPKTNSVSKNVGNLWIKDRSRGVNFASCSIYQWWKNVWITTYRTARPIKNRSSSPSKTVVPLMLFFSTEFLVFLTRRRYKIFLGRHEIVLGRFYNKTITVALHTSAVSSRIVYRKI